MNRKEEIEAAREERKIRSMTSAQDVSFTKKIWSMAGAASAFVLVASLSVGFGVSLATGGGASNNVASGNGSANNNAGTGTVDPGPAPAPSGDLAVKGAQTVPANAETDSFIFTNIGVITESAPLQGTTPVAMVDDPSIVDLRIYLDYGCSYCKIFEDVEHRNIQAALATPEVTVSYHIMGFLGSYSNAAGSASACVASLEPSRWDEVHLKLFSGQAQGTSLSSDEQAGGYVSTLLSPLGLNSETTACIADMRHVTWLSDVTSRYFSLPQSNDGKVIDGTPTVIADGVMYIGEAFDVVGKMPGLLAKHREMLK